MGDSPMRPLVRGRVFYARRDRFTHPGVHVWALKRHWRVLPLPRKRADRDD